MIELPITISIPKSNEIPQQPAVQERLKNLQTANIVRGYTITDNNDLEKNPNFKYYVELNLNNSELWKVILKLTSMLPKHSALIFGLEDDELNYGDYMETNFLLNSVSRFEKELVQDSYIEWGIIYSDQDELVEIYIPGSKYIKFWGSDKIGFQRIMLELELEEVKGLEFIDEYPKIRRPLKRLDGSAIESEKIMLELAGIKQKEL